MSNWIKLFNSEINLEVLTKVAPTKGNLVYEYNPFRNYRINLNMYEYLDLLYSLGDLWKNFGISLYCKCTILNEDYIIRESSNKTDAIEFGKNIIEDAYKEGNNIKRLKLEQELKKAKINNGWYNVSPMTSDPVLREAGELCDFISDELNFSLNHPVHLIPQQSYDGSVNLIINDGINVPRLINSRFSATGKNTYEVVDRKGNNDTNIYDLGELFDIDTSLYKRVIKIPKINFKGVSSGGNLKIGNYYFYFKLSDADGNETDFIGESGLVSVFIGFNDYHSATTGLKNQNSFKQVTFLLSNIDSSYDYVTVYYSRSTAEGLENSVTEYAKIDKKYLINNASIANVIITGNENTINIAPADINLNYNIIDSAYTSATCLNMLFMGNVHKPDIPYRELTDLSLRFLPYLKEEEYAVDVDHNYFISTTSKGYLDPKFIYNKTGYWGNEIYRFGIVYILKNGELSPVFNVRGNYNIKLYEENNHQYTDIKVWEDYSQENNILENHEPPKRRYINYHEEKYNLLEKEASLFENVKGVVSFNPTRDTNTIYSVDFRVDDDTIQELKKHVRGYFFVRQTRIPTILAQGITIGIDKESHTPTIPTASGLLDDLSNALTYTHVETQDINDVNYISEGFLSRYLFEFKRSGSIWGWVGKAIATIALVAATVISVGSLAPVSTVLGGLLLAGSAATTIGASTVALITTTAIVAGAATGAALVAGGIASIVTQGNKNEKKSLNGRILKTPAGCKKSELDDSRKLDQEFKNRIIIKDSSKNIVAGILCPDYTLNQPYYNQIFTGNNHLIELTISQNINNLNGYSSNYFTSNERHFYVPAYYDRNIKTGYQFKIIGVSDGVKAVGLDNMIFRSKAGEAEEAWRYECVGDDYKSNKVKTNELNSDSETEDNKKINSDIIRGNFGPYLAFNDLNNRFQPAETVNIYIPEYSTSNMEDYFYIRMIDNSTFHAITDRFDIQDINEHLVVKNNGIVGSENKTEGYHINAYRGDCYICLFTHRVIRNFNDPSAPYNDEVVDENSWKNNYDTQNQDKYQKINLGDVNAILLGMWVTFKVRSSNNLNIRTLDNSFIDEEVMTGHPRGYFPYNPMSVEGNFKHPDSSCYNKGFSKSVSDKWNFEMPDVPHIKNWFGTRIIYSDIHINDAFKNGFRVFRGTNYRDYTREYGEIVKLIPLESSLLCVFEHGVALIPVNERAIAGQGSGGNVYINTSNVLPENPKIISDMFGSLWPESIIKVPGRTGSSAQYVYGVDTVAKKIWRTDGNILECISDFRVQEFLNNNITLGERELTPIIGIRNVKTHYNAFKRDVMFTFYDNTYGFEEKVWNLCWNEILQKFVTFYSWVPSYSENINNIPFSFDRTTSKWIAKLGTSHAKSSFADGITLTNVIIEDSFRDDKSAIQNNIIPVTYTTKSGELRTINYKVTEEGLVKFIAGLSINNRILPESQMHYRVDFTLERDNYGNYKLFKILPLDVIDGETIENKDGTVLKGIKLPPDAMFPGAFVPLYGLYFNDGGDELLKVYYNDDGKFYEVSYGDDPDDKVIIKKLLYKPEALYSELYYRNSAGNAYADYDTHKLSPDTVLEVNEVIGLGDKFTEDDVNIISETLQISLEEAEEYIGESKSWVKNEKMLTLFEKLYPAETIIGNTSTIYNIDNPPSSVYPCTNVGEIRSIMYETGGQIRVHGIRLDQHWVVGEVKKDSDRKVHYNLPVFKDITGKRPILPKEQQLNPDKIVTLLNIKAHISVVDSDNSNMTLSDTYYNMKASYQGSLIDIGQYESTVAIIPRWNLQFLSTDFWKHGQAGIIDIADDIKPTMWYGKQHPFEFEFIVVNDPSIHKIFLNIELVANKAKPESFHYEIIGECYDFAKDKVNMYFRLEAIKALWLNNGSDIAYDRNFLKVQPRQLAKSADLLHTYYSRKDSINEIEDFYVSIDSPKGYDHRHLSGAEIVYYPNRNEYRIWNHAPAINADELNQDDARSIIASNCQYLEDRWKITINPILVCYKNEYTNKRGYHLILPNNSNWTNPNRPQLPVLNSPIPNETYDYLQLRNGEVEIPEVLINLGYSSQDMDMSNWATDRKEIDVKDKFIKVRIRYSGEELAVIDFLNTIYRISYA